MKKIAIIQSNYIPWKGYFDLINSADALGVNPQAVDGYGQLDKVQSEIGKALFNIDDELGNIKRA